SEDYQKYSTRASNFENLFDPSTGFMRPKKNGGFVSPFAPNEVTFNFTEGNSWVYSFFVPQDIERLMELYGGHDKFASKLDELFSTTDKLAGREQPDITGLIGQYAHGNEPSHHIAYLYDYAGQPWKTQKLVRKIMDEFYKPEPDGLIGNEDCGQMSAWYILSASGLYEVTPGSGIYAFGTPLFKEIKYTLENGKTFTIKAPDVSAKNFYIRSARLNGQPYKKAFISHADVMNGGTLEFEMADHPFMTAFDQFPSTGSMTDFVAVPVIEGGGRTFDDHATVTLSTILPGAKIMYGTDRTDPPWMPYTGSFSISATTRIFAKTIAANGSESQIAESSFIKKPNNWTVKIDSKYNRQYTGGGDEGLIDGIRGNLNFASGEWQGYQGQDFVATVDLQKETQVLLVGGGFLQNAKSWIWMPTHVEFELSSDGVNFDKVADIKTDVAPTDMEPKIRDYTMPLKPRNARYVRIHAYNLGKIPAWHPGAGGDAFIFVDEIIVK
ncbi:MAG: GH92 family glycosyl hydrolase, partial [Pyrinomonadaceae bacterium]